MMDTLLERNLDGLILDSKGRPCMRRETVREALVRRAEDDPRFLSVLENMETGWKYGNLGPRATGYTYREMLTPERVVCADGAQILNSTTEAIMCPDFTFAGDALKRGSVLKYTLIFDWSTVITTPGTLILALRWGGVGGTALCTSGAFAPDPTAAGTTLTSCVEYYVIVRTDGTAAIFFAAGKWVPNDFDDASATTIIGNLNMQMIPASAPAQVGSLDTTTSKALSPTAKFSVATATTQLTNHIAILESLSV